MNIYDTINQLAAELKETPEYKDLQASYEKLSQNEEAFKLFKDVNDIQKDLQAKQMSGQELTQEDMTKANELGQQMEKNRRNR
ncbi:YlbF family regulator [Holzapfeliella floricola]|uniref:YlbF family regulator n=1 Tax=Holzapfeliella floricola TaxID=679249 RepID=UPI00078366E0|nr:YlbF family regulator [Holzapfeliella floricola]